MTTDIKHSQWQKNIQKSIATVVTSEMNMAIQNNLLRTYLMCKFILDAKAIKVTFII